MYTQTYLVFMIYILKAAFYQFLELIVSSNFSPVVKLINKKNISHIKNLLVSYRNFILLVENDIVIN